jgi:protein SCO1/2
MSAPIVSPGDGRSDGQPGPPMPGLPTPGRPTPGLPTIVWAMLVAGLCFALLAGVAAFMRARRVDLPVLAEVPAFSMKNQAGQAVTPAELRGQPFIADFVFLSCRTSCPKLTERMKLLHDRIRAKSSTVRLVSITVDPENDDVPALAKYTATLGLDPKIWSFLTGPIEQLDGVVVKGFKVQYEKVKPIDPNATVFTIMHGDWFVLVDGKGRIRGYYDTHDPKKLDEILDNAQLLARYPDR